jgi:hypothetical protein
MHVHCENSYAALSSTYSDDQSESTEGDRYLSTGARYHPNPRRQTNPPRSSKGKAAKQNHKLIHVQGTGEENPLSTTGPRQNFKSRPVTDALPRNGKVRPQGRFPEFQRAQRGPQETGRDHSVQGDVTNSTSS